MAAHNHATMEGRIKRMRLVTFKQQGSDTQRLGAIHGDRVVDLGLEDGRTMLDLIDDGQATRLEGIEPSIGAEGKQLSEVILCAPIPRPRANVICLGRNYYE